MSNIGLTAEQMEQRKKVLQDLYDKGYRYIARNERNDDLLYGTEVRGRLVQFGVWGLNGAKSFLLTGIDKDLFPDIKWEDDYPFEIVSEIIT